MTMLSARNAAADDGENSISGISWNIPQNTPGVIQQIQ